MSSTEASDLQGFPGKLATTVASERARPYRKWYVIFEWTNSRDERDSSTYREHAATLSGAIEEAVTEFSKLNNCLRGVAFSRVIEAGVVGGPGNITTCTCPVPSLVEGQACRLCGRTPR